MIFTSGGVILHKNAVAGSWAFQFRHLGLLLSRKLIYRIQRDGLGGFYHLLLGHSAYRLGTLLRVSTVFSKGLAQIPGFQPAQVVGHGAEGIGDAHFRGVQILRAEITLLHRLKLSEDFLPGLRYSSAPRRSEPSQCPCRLVIGGGTVIAQAQLFPDVKNSLEWGVPPNRADMSRIAVTSPPGTAMPVRKPITSFA